MRPRSGVRAGAMSRPASSSQHAPSDRVEWRVGARRDRATRSSKKVYRSKRTERWRNHSVTVLRWPNRRCVRRVSGNRVDRNRPIPLRNQTPVVLEQCQNTPPSFRYFQTGTIQFLPDSVKAHPVRIEEWSGILYGASAAQVTVLRRAAERPGLFQHVIARPHYIRGSNAPNSGRIQERRGVSENRANAYARPHRPPFGRLLDPRARLEFLARRHTRIQPAQSDPAAMLAEISVVIQRLTPSEISQSGWRALMINCGVSRLARRF